MDQITSVHPARSDQRLTQRSTAEVLEDHLRLRIASQLEDDLRRNYAEGVVLLTCNSVLRGHDAIRESCGRLREQLPSYALLVWTANSDGYRVRCGADSFVIREGKIRMQTIHYDLLPPDRDGKEPA